jgi:polyphenol oxidase
MSSRLEFPLAQGFAKGLTLCFEDEESSKLRSPEKFVFMNQVHGGELREIGPSDLRGNEVGPCDGLMTTGDWFKAAGKALAIKTADCVPLIYVDFQNQSIAAIHAGWRGLQKKIHLKPFESGSFNPATTWVWLGPSLNGKTFEVREDMYSQFTQKNDPKIFEPHADAQSRYFYPWRLIENDFTTLKVHMLYNVEEDTYMNTDFASYRRQRAAGTKTRNISWVGFI